ncbi:MAG: arabinogalactan endo-1,4-beta-galactosidase [Bacteroides sp.]|nr:arabinogalactan endo-1,4-beta-galactosidase [Bacteroides sp.]
MKNITRLCVILTMGGITTLNLSAERYVGGDISLLPEYEEAGAVYKDESGKPIENLLPFLRQEGMNAMRVRVFVNPEDYKGEDADPNACQTIESVIPLCKRIKQEGMALMLDFHYSDTWADPAKQYTPKVWEGLDDGELAQALYDYTRQSLLSLGEAGITPDFIQTGNEISYGMLWGPEGTPEEDQRKTFMGSNANWERLGELLRSAGKACREVCPDAEIVLHTERTGDIPVQENFYREMERMEIDYDIIGLSYYPYFHGPLSSLDNSLSALESDFPDKDIMVVETGYSYRWEVPGTNCPVDYPYSEEGQANFAKDLVDMLRAHEKVDGLFWWWMEYNAFNTDLSGWYNAPLFDSMTGRVLPALKEICSFASGSNRIPNIIFGKDSNNETQSFYDLSGRPTAKDFKGVAVDVKDGRKLVVR